jgi:FK506-binding protein 1
MTRRRWNLARLPTLRRAHTHRPTDPAAASGRHWATAAAAAAAAAATATAVVAGDAAVWRGGAFDLAASRSAFFSASDHAAFCAPASAAPTAAAVGSRVGVRFSGSDAATGEVLVRLEDGAAPLSFTVGQGRVLPGIEDAILGKKAGEKVSVEIADAYGEHNPKWLKTMPRDERIPSDIKVGERLELSNKRGSAFRVVVVEVGEEEIKVDGNHPLAGRTIKFDVSIDSVDAPQPKVAPTDEIAPGNGKDFPRAGDLVTISYVGTLEETGAVFDSSRDRGTPFQCTIGVGMVIKGWDEGVVQMSLGQRALLKIPSDKGYGSRGAGSAIPPDSNLIFDVELHRIERDGGSGETLSAPGFS